MTLDKGSVSEELVEEEVSPEETPSEEEPGIGEGETPMPEASDGDGETVDYEKLYQDAQAEINKIKSKSEEDIRNLKSSLQRGEHQRLQESQQRIEALKKELQETKMAEMDDLERAKFEAQIERERREELEQNLEEYSNKFNAQEQFNNALAFFVNTGVPVEKLDTTSGTVEALTNSWYKAVTEELATLRETAQDPSKRKPESKAPPVNRKKTSSTKTAPTWDDLIKAYGSRERVYQKVEQGKLPGSIIPKPGE